MAEVWQLQFLLGKVINEPDFAQELIKSPKAAAESAGIHLTNDEIKFINGVIDRTDISKLDIIPHAIWREQFDMKKQMSK